MSLAIAFLFGAVFGMFLAVFCEWLGRRMVERYIAKWKRSL